MTKFSRNRYIARQFFTIHMTISRDRRKISKIYFEKNFLQPQLHTPSKNQEHRPIQSKTQKFYILTLWAITNMSHIICA